MTSLAPSQHLALAAMLGFSSSSWANDQIELSPSIVSSSALGSQQQQMITPSEVLQGQDLMLKRSSNLGQTLESLPGLRSSSFGPGVGRPFIRGLDGARVKVLSDGVDALDASSISPDHANAINPLLAERIEVLKGPASLLYGGGAIGGVINVIDKKVPTYIPEAGYEGVIELGANSVAKEKNGVFGVTAGHEHFAIRAEGSQLKADDYNVPGQAKRQDGSYNKHDSYSLGASFIGERGYIGAAYSEQNLNYGLLVHEHADCHTHAPRDWHCGNHGHHHDHSDEHESTPYIDLRQQRWDIRSELNNPFTGFELARLRIANSRYSHDEIEGQSLATTFENRATDTRLELTHNPVWNWKGVIGLQSARRDFSAQGEAAFVPPTLTRNHGVFLLEESVFGNWRYQLGLRHEWQDIDATGARNTQHRGHSASAGVAWTFTPDYSLGLSLSRSQRLPTAEELYADGPHAASNTIELGNPNLSAETALNTELTLRKLSGATTFTVSLYRNNIRDFIYAADTGHEVGGGFREIQYRQEDAVLSGAETQIRVQASEATALSFTADYTRGKLRSGGNLPRIPSERFGVRIEQRLNHSIDSYLELTRIQKQTALATFEQQTAGYNQLGAGLTYSHWVNETHYELYLKGDNLLNSKAREHVSFIKDEVLLPGRNLTLGLRLSF